MNTQANPMEDAIWEKIKLARHPKRPTAQVILPLLVERFTELHGDRAFSDDPAFMTGLAFFDGIPVTVIAQEKGITTEEKIKRNFGMPHPEGYKKALRLMKQAEKFKRPILIIIDTPGAFPGLGAEERGQGQAIAQNLFEMIDLKVPTLAVVLSEGGSGGALAIGVTDRLYMFENSIYSIISPEGFASIIFKDSAHAKKAAGLMKLTADDLLQFGIIDGIIPEVKTGLQDDIKTSVAALKAAWKKDLKTLLNIETSKLLALRNKKFRKFGVFQETQETKEQTAKENTK